MRRVRSLADRPALLRWLGVPRSWAAVCLASLLLLVIPCLDARQSLGQQADKPATSAEPGSPRWVRVAVHAPWKPRDSSGEVAYGGRMWLLGGWFNSHGPFPNDVWSSSDGAQWTLVTPAAPWVHADLATTLVYDNRMWLLGGWYQGRLPGASASNQVWHSSNGTVWRQATAHAEWSPRLGAGGATLAGKMWLLGGIQNYYFGTRKDLLNDVWSSTDGAHWEQATPSAPWAPRAYHGVLAFDNKLWVLGGGNYLPAYEAHHDVWSSPDGVHWTQATDKAPWHARIWFSALVYKNRMWVLGGWSNKPSQNWNDVWYSSDGANWKQLQTEQVWSKRHEHSAYVFDGKIWVVAGNAWPCTNDVWRLELPPDWPE